MSLITIEQLLESVDLDFEPRWVTKDKDGCITLFSHKPDFCSGCYHQWKDSDNENPKHKLSVLGALKLAEFQDKPWSECIYEVPRKGTGKIYKFDSNAIDTIYDSNPEKFKKFICGEIVCKLNEVIDAVNELKSRAENMQPDTKSRQVNVQPPKISLYTCSDGAVFVNEAVAKSHEASLKSKQSMN